MTGVGGTGRRHHRRDPRHGGSSRGQGLRHDRHGRPRPEGRRRLQPCPSRQRPGRHPRHPRHRRRGRPRARLRPRRHRAPRRCWPRSRRAAPALVVNTAEIMPGDFTRNADFSLPAARIKRAITAAAGGERVDFVDATRDRDRHPRQCHRGEHVHARLRLSARPGAALGRRHRHAIELNGEAVKMNLDAFDWGRRAAAEPEVVARPHGRAHRDDRVAPPLAEPRRDHRPPRSHS